MGGSNPIEKLIQARIGNNIVYIDNDYKEFDFSLIDKELK